jgi:hypothetical protein
MDEGSICYKLYNPPKATLICEDNLAVVSHAPPQENRLVYRGWCLIEPRRRSLGLADITAVQSGRIGRVLALLSGIFCAEHV